MFDKILTRIENTVIVVAFVAMTVIYFANVLSRYVLHGSLSFTTEIVINLAVLLTMVGASAGVRLGTHPDFDLLPSISKGVLRTGLVSVIAVGTLGFFLVFVWLGWDMTSGQRAQGRVTPALGLPQWIFSMALPVGAALGAIRAVQAGYNQIRQNAKGTNEAEMKNTVAEEATS